MILNETSSRCDQWTGFTNRSQRKTGRVASRQIVAEQGASSLLHRSQPKRPLMRLGLTWHHKTLARYFETVARGAPCHLPVWSPQSGIP